MNTIATANARSAVETFSGLLDNLLQAAYHCGYKTGKSGEDENMPELDTNIDVMRCENALFDFLRKDVA